MKFPVLILSLTLVVPAIGVEFSLPANDVTWTTSGKYILWHFLIYLTQIAHRTKQYYVELYSRHSYFCQHPAVT